MGCAPSLGMLRPANFVPRPLHDPAGEFAIVLYDPTIDDEPPPKIPDGTHKIYGSFLKVVMTVVEEKKESKVHKSLADILGIPKRGQVVVEQPKVAVVIDPRIAKVLRPHQIEGVKVSLHSVPPDIVSLSSYDWENPRWSFWMYHGR